jgi:hypothetical protein
MDSISANLPGTHLVHEQEVELFKRFWHAGQKRSFLPTLRRWEPPVSVRSSMVDLKEEVTKPLVKLVQGHARGTLLMTDIAIEIAEEHLVDGPEEPLDTAAALRLTRYRKHQPDLEVSGYLLKVLGGKVGAVVCVEDIGHAADLPVRMPFTPYPLPQSKRGSDGRRRVKSEIISGDRPAVIVDHDR